jgi:hypothetical protein
MAVTFPIYAAQGWPAQIDGSGLTELTIAHTDTGTPICFTNGRRSRAPPRPTNHARASRDRSRSAGALGPRRGRTPHSDDLSDAAITPWFRAGDRLSGRSRRTRPVPKLRSPSMVVRSVCHVDNRERTSGRCSPSRWSDCHDRRAMSSVAACWSNHSLIRLRACSDPSRTRPRTRSPRRDHRSRLRLIASPMSPGQPRAAEFRFRNSRTWGGGPLGVHAAAETAGDSWMGSLRYGAAPTVAAPANRR